MRALWAVAGAAAVGFIACADGAAVRGSSGGQGQGGHAGNQGHDAGTSTGKGGSGATGGGGSGPVGDAIPIAAVSYFQGSSCPTGWAPHDVVAGRVAVPTMPGALGGATAGGSPLASGEDRTHTHTLDASFTLPSFSYVGIAGEANHGVAAAGTVTASAPVDAASLGLPYVQLLACKKQVDPPPGAPPPPPGMLMFFEAASCPAGWQQAVSTEGRLLVGLPEGAPADMPFGGTQLDGTTSPTHAHIADPILVTSPHGIALASGCCASGYAVDGTYQSVEDTGATDPGLPIITLMQCQKQ